MWRYSYSWLPLIVVVGTAIVLTIPYLALIALMVVTLGALAALAWAIVIATRPLSRAISSRWPGRIGESSLSPTRQNAEAVGPALSTLQPASQRDPLLGRSYTSRPKD
jgi:O-antigen ligase